MCEQRVPTLLSFLARQSEYGSENRQEASYYEITALATIKKSVVEKNK